jgi:hypothetical protein
MRKKSATADGDAVAATTTGATGFDLRVASSATSSSETNSRSHASMAGHDDGSSSEAISSWSCVSADR